jgi:hypothetical protein
MKNSFDSNSKFPFKLSRSKIELFLECPRCFYLDRRSGIFRPGMPAFTLNSAVDDLWINNRGELHIVDYKSTNKNDEITLDGEYQQSYKRQAEVYQWLFRQGSFKVSPIDCLLANSKHRSRSRGSK